MNPFSSRSGKGHPVQAGPQPPSALPPSYPPNSFSPFQILLALPPASSFVFAILFRPCDLLAIPDSTTDARESELGLLGRVLKPTLKPTLTILLLCAYWMPS